MGDQLAVHVKKYFTKVRYLEAERYGGGDIPCSKAIMGTATRLYAHVLSTP